MVANTSFVWVAVALSLCIDTIFYKMYQGVSFVPNAVGEHFPQLQNLETTL